MNPPPLQANGLPSGLQANGLPSGEQANRLPPTEMEPYAGRQVLQLRFTGSGSEYFRIWVVNLLLTVLTLSLYHPFARARRLRYFHANTLVDGHALGFHGDPWKMLRGHLIVLAFAIAYGVAGSVSPAAGWVAGVLFAALWPALWQASLRFRLANTSWRGLRLRFTGPVAGAYRALLPLWLPGLAFLMISSVADRLQSPPVAMAMLLAGLMLVIVGLVPLTLARIKRYQHDHYHFANEATRCSATNRAFYQLWFRSGLVGLGALVVLGAGMAWAGSVLQANAGLGDEARDRASFAFAAVGMVFYGLLVVGVQPVFVAGLQNLVWGRTASARMRFDSRLGALPLAALTLRNLLLMVVTLGLYRPFAVIATARLRLQAMQVIVRGDPSQWVSDPARLAQDAAGDAAGDLLGVDLGL